MSITQHAESVRALTKQYRAVLELGAFLDKVGTIENLEGELKARAERARKELERVDRERQGAIEKLEADLKTKTAAAREVLERVDRERMEAETARDTARRALEALNQELAVAKDEYSRVSGEIEALRARLG